MKDKMPDISVKIAGIRFPNPVFAASGTFGYGSEYAPVTDIASFGGVITKTITLKPRAGNPPPRIMETPSGIMNSIGLENVGLDAFLKDRLPELKKLTKNPVIVSIGASSAADFTILAGRLDKVPGINALELNISCPNVRGRIISQDRSYTYRTVKAVRKVFHRPVFVKLSPNVTDITQIALASQRAGADALSLINTISAMVIDVDTRVPFFRRGLAGLSGPAIRPIGVRMVWECFRKVDLPIIGIGGIMNASDALEYILAGASAVEVGTGIMVHPGMHLDIIRDIREYLLEHGFDNIKRLVGGVKWPAT